MDEQWWRRPTFAHQEISDAEKKLASEIFLAPYVPGCKIQVKVNGVVYDLNVADPGPLAERGGFGLFRMSQTGIAKFEDVAPRARIDAYLKLLPRVTMVLIDEFEKHWWGIQASSSDTRFTFSDPVPLQLVERPSCFQQIHTRFDGSTFWYHGENRRRDPSIAKNLRDALERDVKPDELQVPAMSPRELFAYRIVYYDKHPLLDPKVNRELQPRTDLARLREALTHAGARLDTYWAVDDEHVTVRYVVDGLTHSANVRLDDFTVTSSGICLSGRDNEFDLTSLVGVMREFYAGE